ncbi:nuclear transport factor 2 family protein [Methanoculleus sp.]|uniref:nuclear transport factor 2 family protein n=1 Tax=Methanoculleus sp. TaxID=90427 RepID=UPI002FCA857F
MEDLVTVLLEIEKRAWKANDARDVAFYREYLAPGALVVSPWGVLDREGILGDLVKNPHELPEYTVQDEKVVPLGEESAVLTYTVSLGVQTFYLCGVEGAEREGSLRKGGGESGAPSSLSRCAVILYDGEEPT